MLNNKVLKWYYVYVLQSLKDRQFYIGYTENLEKRLKQHNAKTNVSTKCRTPFEYIYVEACRNEKDAKRREDYLKTTQGGRFLKLRLKEFMEHAPVLEHSSVQGYPVENFDWNRMN